MRMIGIAFGWPTEFEKTQFGIPDEVRFARIEQGPVVKEFGPYYWRRWNPPEAEELAKKISDQIGVRSREITGFTLFYQTSVYTKTDGTRTDGPGFQMSIRRKNEDGWDVNIIPKEQAETIFRLLESSGHPDGPWKLRDVDASDSYVVPQSEVEGWEKLKPYEEPEYFEGEQVEETGDLLTLLAAAEAARREETAALLPE